MADPQVQKAKKRLMQDLAEFNSSPVENVSAQPLDSDMFEWHCNFLLEDTVFHLILFFPPNYPFVSPSAEFVPQGYQFTGGATDRGKKGVKVCLSIFSDFAKYHTEWADEKGMGWSPCYTVQTVLLNLLSFLTETMENSKKNSWSSSYMDDIEKNNKKLAMGYKCKDCGHTHAKPYPALINSDDVATAAATAKGKGKGKGKTSGNKSANVEERYQIVDYISKTKFDSTKKPKNKDELFGYGLIVSGPDSRPSLTTPCEFLTGESFFSMKNSVGKVHSMLKEEIKYFVPMFIHKNHGSEIKDAFEDTMKELTNLLKSCKRASVPEMVIKTIPNLMSATVVEFSKGQQHTSDNALNGYFALHRLLLWAVETYPELQGLIDDKLAAFIDDENMRYKNKCPHIGEWLLLLTASAKYRWQDAAEAYLGESWRRNVMWYVKDDAKLGYLDTPKDYRLPHTFKATVVSRKLLAFQVLFLDIAMPASLSRQQIIARYDGNSGFPTDDMVAEMKAAVDRIKLIDTKPTEYEQWYKVLKLPVPTEDEIYKKLVAAVEFSINTNGYHWTFWKNQGGWKQVLAKYPKGTPGWADKAPSKEKKEPASKATKAKGKASKSTEETMDTTPAPKGKGRGKRKAEEPLEDEEEKPVKGRGRGKKAAAEPVKKGGGGKAAKIEEEAPVAKGRGRGGKAGGARGRGRGKRGK